MKKRKKTDGCEHPYVDTDGYVHHYIDSNSDVLKELIETTNENLMKNSNQPQRNNDNKVIRINNDNKYTMNCILSFNHINQLIYDIDLTEVDLLNKENLLRTIIDSIWDIEGLSREDLIQLVKISTHLYDKDNFRNNNYWLFNQFTLWDNLYQGKYYIQSGDFRTIYESYGINLDIRGGNYIMSEEFVDALNSYY